MDEQPLGPSGPASVVLDIGGDVGALVVELPAELCGQELDLLPVGGVGGTSVHTAVRERHVLGEVRYAAVYPAVRAGTYRVERVPGTFVVEGGRVTEVPLATR
jgi:hypothetical protein